MGAAHERRHRSRTVLELLTVAGTKELASRVRPSARRPGQAEGAEEDTDDEPKPAPTAGPPALGPTCGPRVGRCAPATTRAEPLPPDQESQGCVMRSQLRVAMSRPHRGERHGERWDRDRIGCGRDFSCARRDRIGGEGPKRWSRLHRRRRGRSAGVAIASCASAVLRGGVGFATRVGTRRRVA